MTTYDAEFWEQHYVDTDPAWGTSPNQAMVDTISQLFADAGTALELGAGHGGDALWLARAGWTVTALDVARTALDRIAANAAQQDLSSRIVTVHCDATSQPLPGGPFDLVFGSFFYAPRRDDIWRRAADTVTPGGALVIVDHGSSAPWSWDPAGHAHPTPQQVADALELGPAWEPELLDTRARIATGPGGQRAEVTDTIVALRRKAA
ncbi:MULTISPECIES: class I SAM-dependent methyltransferase [unclassified Dietzia]|uniref:class I SAM-dependent methyltransferase n=1 Tax=unclassified Dietzia TaxID=2617939 RepID=UPI0015FA902C|nr:MULTISPECIES: class I SAM-dependent methyltransferase [unclassified Dietzia]MBB1024176.1 class I SAM-dependent methyltransferase [Dietzia sp. DQ12-76]MBB1026323.1 class I SAM-dependent methyltransferase [Dietzia sp. DQ11-38-2]